MTNLKKLLNCLEELRKLDEAMPISRAAAFVLVCQNEGCTMAQLAGWLDAAQSTTSRTVQALGKTHWNGKPGVDLIEAIEDPDYPRRKIIQLTKKGKKVKESIIQYLEQE